MQLGFAPHDVLTIGLIELVCLVLYIIPRTAPIGAVLWGTLYLRDSRVRALLEPCSLT